MREKKTVRFIIRRDYMDDMITALANSGYHVWTQDNEDTRRNYDDPHINYVCVEVEEAKEE